MKRRKNSDAASPPVSHRRAHPAPNASRKERIDAALEQYTVQTSNGPDAAMAAVPAREVTTSPPPELPPAVSASETAAGEPNAADVELIVPTNPEADAAIPVAAAQRARERAAVEAAARENRYDVVPATFVETSLNRRLIYVLLLAWLGAVPVALMLYTLTNSKVSGAPGGFISAIEYLLAAYSLLGWVPLMVLYSKKRRTH